MYIYICIYLAYLLWGFVHLATKVCVLFIMVTHTHTQAHTRMHAIFIFVQAKRKPNHMYAPHIELLGKTLDETCSKVVQADT